MTPRLNNSILLIVVCVAVAAVIVGGFMLAGSPQTAREQQMDMIRSSNLFQITSIVDNYWSQTKTLPTALADLYEASNDGTGFIDPITQQPYEYIVTGEGSFELCAVFDRMGDEQAKAYMPEPSGLPNFYQHTAGRNCFTVTMPTAAKAPIVEPIYVR